VEHLEVRYSRLFEQTLAVESASIAHTISSDPSQPAPTGVGEQQNHVWQALFTAIPVPLVVAQFSDGAILYANEAFCSTFGLDLTEMSQTERQMLDLYYDPTDWHTLLQVFTSQGYLRDYEVRMYKVDGTPVWSSTSLQWLTHNGEPTILGVFGNITRYKQQLATISVCEAEVKFCTLAETMAAATFIYQDSRLCYVNSALCTITGYFQAELLGMNVWDFVHPDYHGLLREMGNGEWVIGNRQEIDTQKETGRWGDGERGLSSHDLSSNAQSLVKSRYDVKILTKKGEVRWLDATTRIIDFLGQPAVLVSAFDITTHKQAQEALHESQRTLSTLMSNLPGMAYRCRHDRDWTMEFVSEGCFSLTGYHPVDFIHSPTISLSAIIYPNDRDRLWHEVQAALQQNRPYQLEYRITTAIGEQKWVWEQGRGILSATGDVLALEGFITDITEHKRAAEVLQLLQTLTQVIAEAPDFETALEVALCKVCEATNWDYGEAWIKSADGAILEYSTAWYSSTNQKSKVKSQKSKSAIPNSQFPIPNSLKEFWRQSQAYIFTPGTGLPGQVWSSRQPV
jgi:PAS domain S-box-containing protein